MSLLQAAQQEQQPQQQAPQEQQPPQQGQQQPQKKGGKKPYDKLLEMMLSYLYSDKGMEMLKAGIKGDPAKNLGMLVGQVVSQIMQQAKESGKKVPPAVFYKAAIEFTAAVVELAKETGQVGDEIDQPTFMEALNRIAALNKDMDPADREQFAQMTDRVMGGGQ